MATEAEVIQTFQARFARLHGTSSS